MDGLTLLIIFALGYGTATLQESPCPVPPERARPPAHLLEPLPLEYLLPENWQPAAPNGSSSSKTAPEQ